MIQKLLSIVMVAFVATCAIAPIALYGHGAHPSETVVPKFQRPIPNIDGKTMSAVLVKYPPGATSAPHTHAPSAFILAYVVSGAITSQVEGGPVRTYRVGESWYENPGDHHLVSANASQTEPAELLAVFVANSSEELTVPDGLKAAH